MGVLKAVILAGGLGSRISEETYLRPKPMVTIGSRPILWHIMKKFSLHGIKDFIICLGYKSEVIKEYFLNFSVYQSDFEIQTSTGETSILSNGTEDWSVKLVETGLNSNTGERLKRVSRYIDDDFFFTYGDGLSSQDLSATYEFHMKKKKVVTLTAVNPPGRYGAVTTRSGNVLKFAEKTSSQNSLINGGFFVVNPAIFEILGNYEDPSWENDILPALASQGQLGAYEHYGFWYAMDTLRDKEHLEKLWESGNHPWLK